MKNLTNLNVQNSFSRQLFTVKFNVNWGGVETTKTPYQIKEILIIKKE